MVMTACRVCRKKFQTYRSRLGRNKGQFCGRSCYATELSRRLTANHFMKGKKHRPESIAKMRANQTHMTGPAHPSWKGGRHMSRGYWNVALLTLSKDEQLAFVSMATRSSQRTIPEHRLVMARTLGRPLLRSEIVHHSNGVKHDNRLENLELHDNPTHKREHWEILRELQALRKENEELRFQLSKFLNPTSPRRG